MDFAWLETVKLAGETLPPWFSAGLVFLIGLSVGSYLNVCIYRWPQEDLSTVKPRSFCPECKHTIRWFDNIPVLSYLFLRGKCRTCGKPISLRYPAVELIEAGALLWLFLMHGCSALFFYRAVFISLLLVATATDFREKIIPDEVSFYGIVFALVMSYAFPVLQGESDHRLGIANSVLGMLSGGGLLYAVAVVGDAMFKRESMGGGDIKLFAMIGSFLSFHSVLPTLIYASVFGSVVGLVLKFTRKAEIIAFGPYLVLGALLFMIWNIEPFLWYSDQVGQWMGKLYRVS